MAQRWMKKVRGEAYAYPYSEATMKVRKDMVEIDEAEAMALLAEYSRIRKERRAKKVAADTAKLYPPPPPPEEATAVVDETPKPKPRKQAVQGPSVYIAG